MDKNLKTMIFGSVVYIVNMQKVVYKDFKSDNNTI